MLPPMEALNTLDHLRLRFKEDFVSFRQRFIGHTISGQLTGISQEAFEKESYWLEKDSSFINRGLPLFSREGRIYYKREKEVFYDFAEAALKHLDALVYKKNPQQDLALAHQLEEDWILDLGCGRGISLEDICAYYNPLLNLKLVGTTLHTPGYQREFAQRNIFLVEAQPLTIPAELVPKQGYSLIMANQVLAYYEDKAPFVRFGQKHRSAEGIFLADAHLIMPS